MGIEERRTWAVIRWRRIGPGTLPEEMLWV
jgi:hypothetical protein